MNRFLLPEQNQKAGFLAIGFLYLCAFFGVNVGYLLHSRGQSIGTFIFWSGIAIHVALALVSSILLFVAVYKGLSPQKAYEQEKFEKEKISRERATGGLLASTFSNLGLLANYFALYLLTQENISATYFAIAAAISYMVHDLFLVTIMWNALRIGLATPQRKADAEQSASK